MPRILVVEDEPLIAMMLENWLAELHCETAGPAGTTAHALQVLESEIVDGAILDWRLGEDDTRLVAEALLARHIPFALATGYGSTVDRFADAPVLSKPYEFVDVARTMDRLVGPGSA